MPKTIAIAARKGGPGKTTLAVNLAAAAANSTIVDIDPQNSAGIWGDRQGVTGYFDGVPSTEQLLDFRDQE